MRATPFVLTAVLLATSFLASADDAATLIIQQESPTGLLGKWILSRPNDEGQLEMVNHASYSLDPASPGKYFLQATAPDGAVGSINLYLDNDLLQTFPVPQATITLEPGTHYRAVITYTFTHVGTVSVTSSPKGVKFTLTGPNNLRVSGTTPASFEDTPIGLYSATFEPVQGCATPAAKSGTLQRNSRVSLDIAFSCADGVLPQKADLEKRLQFVTIGLEGRDIAFTDVPLADWFATHVYTALKTGVMSGYRDEAGTLTGRFGPGDNVSLAQLAKIALAISSRTDLHGAAQNQRANGTWAEPYVATAESLGWLVYQDHREDPSRAATRAEVVATLLQALDVQRLWAKGTVFSDVQILMPYADTIETAAHDGLIDVPSDKTFRPGDPINRAELSKMLSVAMDLYGEDSEELLPESTRLRNAMSSSARSR